MKILYLDLTAYGSFSHQTLDLSAGKEGIHLIYGPNEAGKSSTLRALTGFFYGFPHQSSDTYLNQELRVGARLRHSNGLESSFIRRKGRKNTLLDADGQPLPDNVLQKLLGNLEKEVFSSFFGINHETLHDGGEDILQGQGQLGRSLFSAGMGNTQLREVMRTLEKEAESLFRPRGQKIINKAIHAYKDAKAEKLHISLPSQQWLALEQTIKEVQTKIDQVTKKIHQLRTEKNKWERFLRAIPLIAERKMLLSQLQQLGSLPTLPVDFSKTHRNALEQLKVASNTADRTGEELQQIETRKAALHISETFLQQSQIIQNLHQQLGSYQKAHSDRTRLQGEQKLLEMDADTILKKLQYNTPLAEVESLRLTTAQRRRIQDLGNQRQALFEQKDQTDKKLKQLEKNIAASQHSLKQSGKFQNPALLKQAVKRAEKQGDLELEYQQLQHQLAQETKQIEIERKRLPGWSGTLVDLETLQVPSREMVNQFDRELGQLNQELKALENQCTQNRNKVMELDRQLKELELAGSVPSENELESVRFLRDKDWEAIRLMLIEEKSGKEMKTETIFNHSLLDTYQSIVRKADEMADRLRREAERVAQQATYLADKGKYQEDVRQLEQKILETQQKRSECQNAWNERWHTIQVTPYSPQEMLTWIDQQQLLVQHAEKFRKGQAQLEYLQKSIADHCQAIRKCLQQLDPLEHDDLQKLETSTTHRLDDLIGSAESLVEHIETSNRKREQLEQQLIQSENEMKDAHEQRQTAINELQTWKSNWSSAIQSLGLNENEVPSTVNEVMVELEELFKKIDQVASHTKRIRGIDRDAESYEKKVEIFMNQYAPELEKLPLSQAVNKMYALLEKTKQDSASLKEHQQQQEARQKVFDTARREVEEANQILKTLCQKAQCETIEELEEVEESFLKVEMLQKDLKRVESQLLDDGGGLAIDELIVKTESLDVDTLPETIRETEHQIKSLEQQQLEMTKELGSNTNALNNMDGGGKAAEAAEKVENCAAEIRDGVERYLLVQLSFLILQRQIEYYRKEKQDPLLSSASQYFTRLTLGSFAGLQTDFDAKHDTPILVGVRSDGQQVLVEGMSDGTRDQLYLSLRLAHLEQYLEKHEPIPFIVDDILINFDDQRSEALLHTLAELSQKTQILLFSHHHHLVELAQSQLKQDILHVHSL
ncbi:MAG: AAA family ATPase [SAR324 cluster bacterium]|nr:AAA family ATPase [SAR324 cluster bacterium]